MHFSVTYRKFLNGGETRSTADQVQHTLTSNIPISVVRQSGPDVISVFGSK